MGLDCINLAKGRDNWQFIVYTVMDLQIP